jgi:hypothetical protein
MKKIMFALGTFALAALAANPNNFKVTLNHPTWVGGKLLKPGEYKIQVDGTKAMLKGDKESAETAVKMETGDKKYDSTTLNVRSNGDKNQLEDIRVGGSNTKIVFQSGSAAAE